MLSTEEFKAFAADYVMFAHVTTRIEGRKYDGLLSEKGGRGFPHLVALNKDGDVIANLSGGRDVDSFRRMMESATKFEALKAKADKTLDDEIFLLKHDIAMGNAKLDDAKARIVKFEGLSDAQAAELDGAVLGLEIADALPNSRDPDEAKAQVRAAGKKFTAWLEAGRVPAADSTGFDPFFMLMLDYAEMDANADLFKTALDRLQAKYADNANAAKFFAKQAARLKKLQEGGE